MAVIVFVIIIVIMMMFMTAAFNVFVVMFMFVVVFMFMMMLVMLMSPMLVLFVLFPRQKDFTVFLHTFAGLDDGFHDFLFVCTVFKFYCHLKL